MTTDNFKLFAAPPVNEVGFAIVTSEPFIDPYDIRSAHDIFRDSYPKYERQAPVKNLDVAFENMIEPIIRPDDIGVPPRWWFASESGEELVQAQERFIGWNWRRGVAPDTPVEYPGFDVMHERAKAAFEALANWRRDLSGVLPVPSQVQLMYDNMIPLKANDGSVLRLGQVLRNWVSIDPGVPTFGWQMRWGEHVSDDVMEPGVWSEVAEDEPIMSVSLSILGVITSAGATLPVLRMGLAAVSAVTSWEEAYAFFPKSHDYIRKTFLRLLTEEVLSSWGRR